MTTASLIGAASGRTTCLLRNFHPLRNGDSARDAGGLPSGSHPLRCGPDGHAETSFSAFDPKRSLADAGAIRLTYPIRGSVRLDASKLHYLAPLFGIGGDELAEFRGRAGEHRAS